ncbi:TetR/AcrR family transcriptional regulator [Panacibacter ginsenosidivorans]|uniref:TetR/AcrR family transcriptional regulator n=1 Tax=Panacibacter ginsenosidivorans TaxID=1813871 RepID=A0A5B8VCS7_9BACT|nr:TetR/AcrR family transcriptional regulator [Panacibacter ginsenosidivorans]QEC68803.1 TetR/AcrR family transcriptional regulator [Panacibacter ginsenosidivorans]
MVKKQIDATAEQRILAAAKKIFLSRGLDGARMQDIADEAGINKAMLHYYFRSKDKLFEMIFEDIARHFMPRIVEIFESDQSLFQKIETFCGAYIDQVRQTPYLPVFVLSEATKRPSALMKKMFDNKKPPVHLFFQQVQKEIEKGIIKPINPVQLFLNMLSMCVFPFMAKPMLEHAAGITKKQFDALMEERKKMVPAFIIASIKK